MASKSLEDPPNITSQGHRGFEDDKNEQDELLYTYNEILNEYTKLKKVNKNWFGESLKKGPTIESVEGHS